MNIECTFKTFILFACFLTGSSLWGEALPDAQTPREILHAQLENIRLDVDSRPEMTLGESLETINRDLARIWGQEQDSPPPVITFMPPRTYQIHTPKPLTDLHFFEQAVSLFRRYSLPRKVGHTDLTQRAFHLVGKNVTVFELLALMEASSESRPFAIQTPEGFFPQDTLMRLEYWELPAPEWLIQEAATLPGLEDEEAVRRLPNAFAYSQVMQFLSNRELFPEAWLDVTPLLKHPVLFALLNLETKEVSVIIENPMGSFAADFGIREPVFQPVRPGPREMDAP